MFSFFKRDPIKKLDAKYKSLLETAMQAQRNGDIEQYSKLSEAADDILRQIKQIEQQNHSAKAPSS